MPEMSRLAAGALTVLVSMKLVVVGWISCTFVFKHKRTCAAQGDRIE